MPAGRVQYSLATRRCKVQGGLLWYATGKTITMHSMYRVYWIGRPTSAIPLPRKSWALSRQRTTDRLDGSRMHRLVYERDGAAERRGEIRYCVSGTDERAVLTQGQRAIANLQNHSRVVRLDIPALPGCAVEPWLRAASMWEHNPDREEFQRAVTAYRRMMDAQADGTPE